jgi:hypothetical protein
MGSPPLIWSHRRLHLITFTENHCPAVESGIVNRSELATLRRNCRSARCGQISSHLLRQRTGNPLRRSSKEPTYGSWKYRAALRPDDAPLGESWEAFGLDGFRILPLKRR